jgi:hypothetical protein
MKERGYEISGETHGAGRASVPTSDFTPCSAWRYAAGSKPKLPPRTTHGSAKLNGCPPEHTWSGSGEPAPTPRSPSTPAPPTNSTAQDRRDGTPVSRMPAAGFGRSARKVDPQVRRQELESPVGIPDDREAAELRLVLGGKEALLGVTAPPVMFTKTRRRTPQRDPSSAFLTPLESEGAVIPYRCIFLMSP